MKITFKQFLEEGTSLDQIRMIKAEIKKFVETEPSEKAWGAFIRGLSVEKLEAFSKLGARGVKTVYPEADEDQIEYIDDTFKHELKRKTSRLA
jgi:hypothetical protein